MALTGAVAPDELERGAPSELANIRVSRAAASLRDMVGQHVLLSVPAVAVVMRDEAARLVGDRRTSGLVAVHQEISGNFSGRALLTLPEASRLKLVRAMMSEEPSRDDIIELKQEALAETGDIILNACLATIANILERTLTASLPEITRVDRPGLFALSGPSG